MSDDIYDILGRIQTLNEGQDAAQKSVHQLPALFKPKNISPVLGSKKDPANPFKGYFVGGESEVKNDESIDEGDVVPFNRGGYNKLSNKEDYLDKRDDLYKLLSMSGLDQTMRDHTKQRLADLDKAARLAGIIESSHATEDVLSTMKKKLSDYLSDVATAIKKDPDLKDKLPQDSKTIGPAVKTITTDDGHELKIHGNEDDGFRITIKNKPSKAKFENLEHAVMACEMYCSRRRMVEGNADYVEEKR